MCICMTWAHLIKIIRTPFQPKWQHVEHIDPMLTRIHPIVFLRPMIKQEWPAESNDSLQRYQDNLSSAKYLNLAPGGPQSIQTACFDGYIGAPPHGPYYEFLMPAMVFQWYPTISLQRVHTRHWGGFIAQELLVFCTSLVGLSRSGEGKS